MNREVHVGFCEGVGVKFPRATRPLNLGQFKVLPKYMEADFTASPWVPLLLLDD
jgi:hypothetical protein